MAWSNQTLTGCSVAVGVGGMEVGSEVAVARLASVEVGVDCGGCESGSQAEIIERTAIMGIKNRVNLFVTAHLPKFP